MHHLTPRFILDKWEAGERFGRFHAAALFIDISGFTAVTEALMDAGVAGSEMLADIMVAIFEPLVAAVYDNGGYITDFAGDAFAALFTDDVSYDSTACAVAAAWRINRHLAANPSYETEFGTFEFAVKAGVARGAVEWGIVGNADGLRTFFFRGAAIDGCAHAEHQASGGDVVLHDSVVADVRTWAVIRPIADGYYLVDDADPPAQVVPVIAAPETDHNARAFISPTLLHTSRRGEFRDVVSIFVNIDGPPTTAQLLTFMSTFFELLARYDGTLCRLDFGDKGCNLLIFWGAPASHENDAQRALDFALDLRAATDLTLRMGVTARRGYAGFAGAPRREEYTCYGLGVNLAARQMMVAQWGETLLDGVIAQKAGRFDVHYVNHLRFKGFAELQPVYTLTGRRDRMREHVYAGQLVGREPELAQLADAIRPIFAQQFAGILTIVAEAGMGKSRLAHTFLDQQPVKLLLCQTDEILRQSLNPFRFWLRTYFDQSTQASADTNRQQFNERLDTLLALTPNAGLRDELQRTRSFLAALIDIYWPFSLYEQLEPELRFENTLSALKALIKAESLVQPVVLLLEDAHWLDADSAEFLKRLTRNVAAFPFVVLTTSRAPLEASIVEDTVAQAVVTLTTLGGAAIAQLVADRLAVKPSAALLELLATRTDGNPFFIEQMLLYLQENELLDRLLAEDAVLADDIIVPTDVRAVLVSRLDKLEPAVRDVVQQASVLGREFERPVLAEMVGDAVAVWLDSAENAAIWHPLTDTRYLFQHALMRDAAYDMQLRGRLRNLHSNAATAFEALHEQSYFSAPPYAEIAYHFDHARAAPQAVVYYGKAGGQAKDAYHNEDAIAYFSRGLTLSADANLADTNRFDLLSGREAVFSWVGNRSGQLEDLLHLATLAEEKGDSAESADIDLRLAFYYHVTGQYDEALRHTESALAIAQMLNDASLQFRAYHTWGRVLWKQGRASDARPKLQEALQLATEPAAAAECLYDLGVTYFYQGNHADAQAYIERASAEYERSNNEKGKISCLIVIGNLAEQQGQYSRAHELFSQSRDLCRTVGWRYGESFCLEHLGNSSFNIGSFEQARHYHEQAYASCREIGRKDGEAVSRDVLGLIYLFDGEPRRAQQEFEAALDIQLHDTQDKRSAAYTLTHLGHALRRSEQFFNARAALVQALTIRRDLGQSGLALDTLAALAACALEDGNKPGAQEWVDQLVAEINDTVINSAEFPTLIYWTIYHVLDVLDSHRETALAMLQQGYRRMQQTAENIESENRRLYLTRFPFHNALAAAWAQEIEPA